MSIVTKVGDQGNTRLMFNREVPKEDPRVDAYGAVDELSTAMGMLRGKPETAPDLKERILTVQKQLIGLMGEVSTPPELMAKYKESGYQCITESDLEFIELRISDLESQLGPFTTWSIPGDSELGSLADWARTICRRAERKICALHHSSPIDNRVIMVYLNRMSDWLWLEARALDRQ